MDKFYRHEMKYYINQGEARMLSDRLSLVMNRDPHAGRSGEYSVRSLYFDDIANTALIEKLGGIFDRKKYRIRIYNCSPDVIRLERKEKSGAAIRKETMSITREQCDALMHGDPSFLLEYKLALAQDMFYQIRNRRLKPAVVVDYAREAYVHPFQDVRITMDKRLKSGTPGLNLFDPNLPMVDAMVNYDMILEIKFNEFLPEYFHSLIQLGSSQRSAVSKYILCRNYF